MRLLGHDPFGREDRSKENGFPSILPFRLRLVLTGAYVRHEISG